MATIGSRDPGCRLPDEVVHGDSHGCVHSNVVEVSRAAVRQYNPPPSGHVCSLDVKANVRRAWDIYGAPSSKQ